MAIMHVILYYACIDGVRQKKQANVCQSSGLVSSEWSITVRIYFEIT